MEYDGNGNIIALFAHYNDSVGEPNGSTYYSVGKYTTTGAKIWTARLANSFYTDGWGLAVDTENNWIYVAGVSSDDEPGNYNLSLLTKFDSGTGDVEWSKSYDFGFGCQSPVVDVDLLGNPIVVGYAYNGDDNYVTTTKINADTGAVTWSRSLDGQEGEEAYGMAVGPAGEVVSVGYMAQLDVAVSRSVTPLTGSTTDVLVINRSDLSGDTLTASWVVAGTGITGTASIGQINIYNTLTSTVQQGTGATFNFVIAGDGSLNNPVTVANGGTGYLVGHKIKIPYTEPFGGADANSDIIITVTGATNGVITSVAAGYFGAGSGTPNSYYGFVGTNYQTGSGLTFDLFSDSASTYTNQATYISTAGTNYVTGDVVVIPGTQLGGTSPANDLTATVITPNGAVTGFSLFSGTQQTTTYRISVIESVDFSGTGTWTLSGTTVDTDNRMLVVKYNSAGAIQWQKAILFDAGFDSTGADADIDSEGNVYVCGQYESDTAQGPVGQCMSIVKFNSLGVKQWMRRVDGNCGGWTSSIVVGPDDKLYLSATTFTGTDSNDLTINTVLAKYNLDGTVAWQRLLDYTEGLSFGNFGFFYGPGGLVGSGSNLAVKQGYVAVGLGFSADFQGNPEELRAAVAQVSATGDLFAAGSWDFKAASFSGMLDDDASEITVVNAGKTDSDNSTNIDIATVSPISDVANFLLGTLYTAGGADDRLVSGANQLTLETTGTVTLPAGGTISEGYVTSNPTIQLTPASPSVASQKLVIKGGASYIITDNGITLNYQFNTALPGATLEFYIDNASTYADQTLYWWIYPESAGLTTPSSGTVSINEFGNSGPFTFVVDSADYEFTVRVSPENNNYDPANIGVESYLINADEPAFASPYHLHLTTGDLTETSIFLGTDDHNVRTTTDGTIQITTYRNSYSVNNVWEFDTDGGLTFPDGTTQTTAAEAFSFSVAADDSTQRLISNNELIKFIGAGGITTASDAEGNITINYVQGDIRSEGNINIDINLSDSTLRRWTFGEDGNLTVPGDIATGDGESFLKDIPQNSPTGYTVNPYVLQASDRGRHILIDGSEGNSIEIPTDATEPMPIGSAIVLVIKPGEYTIFVGPEDGLVTTIHGAGVGSNMVYYFSALNGGAMATLVKIGANEWMISGTGLAEYTGP